MIPGRRQAFSVPCPGLFSIALHGARETEHGFSNPSLRSPRTDTSALVMTPTGEGALSPSGNVFTFTYTLVAVTVFSVFRSLCYNFDVNAG